MKRTCVCSYHHFASEIKLDCEECLERIYYKICYHCAPAIFALKPANMISLRGQLAHDYLCNRDQIEASLPLKIKILARDNDNLKLFVYNPEMLSSYLSQPKIVFYLRTIGYNDDSLEVMLEHLSERFQQTCPDEIGLFLGYPLNDVVDFRTKSKPCLLTGYWKVYSQPREAKATFSKYDSAKQKMSALLQNGSSPSAILHNLTFNANRQVLANA